MPVRWLGWLPPRLGARAARDPLGARGERAAARLLRRAGYRILARNVWTAAGEADIVCLDPDGRTIVVVEVKARRVDDAQRQPPPQASVGARKQARLRAVAEMIARRNGWEKRPVRIDVVAVEVGPARPRLTHFVNAVGGR